MEGRPEPQREDIRAYKEYLSSATSEAGKPFKPATQARYLRAVKLFFKHDLVSGEPIIARKLDIILCRNVLIYFNHDLQNKVLKFFHENLADDGCLIIGRHEGMIGHVASLFDKKDSIYFKKTV
ncbi:MAG: hypothetical protein IIT32_04340, partial [Bacteroidales bacterium]|nr:hypothetical protein [Bacteroidales bacterium]